MRDFFFSLAPTRRFTISKKRNIEMRATRTSIAEREIDRGLEFAVFLRSLIRPCFYNAAETVASLMHGNRRRSKHLAPSANYTIRRSRMTLIDFPNMEWLSFRETKTSTINCTFFYFYFSHPSRFRALVRDEFLEEKSLRGTHHKHATEY